MNHGGVASPSYINSHVTVQPFTSSQEVGTVLANVGVGTAPEYSVYDPLNGYIYVENSGSANVSVISAAKVVANLPVGTTPNSGLFDSGTGSVYVTNSGTSDNVSVLTGTAVTGAIALGTVVNSATYDPNNGEVFVTEPTSGHTAIILGTSVVTTVATGAQPVTAAYDPTNSEIFVVSQSDSTVTVVCGASAGCGIVAMNAVVTSLALPANSHPDAITYDSYNGYLFVTDFQTNQVTAINGATNAILASFGVGGGGSAPDAVTYDSGNGEVYVTSSGNALVNVLSGQVVIPPNPPVTNVGVGNTPDAVAYDSGNGNVYVTNEGAGPPGTVSVVSGFSVTATLTAQTNPDSITFNGGNGNLYVTNHGSASVTIISTLLQENPIAVAPTGNPSFSTDLGSSATFWANVTALGNGADASSAFEAPAGLGCAAAPTLSVSGGVGTNSLACTPVNAGTYTIWMNASDTAGGTASSSATYTVYPALSVTTPFATKTTVDIGQSVTFITTASGGTGTYTNYVWSESSPTLGCTLLHATRITCVPTAAGSTYIVSVMVTDSNGKTSALVSSSSYTVWTDPSVSVPSPSSTSADVGQPITFGTTPSGGTGTYNTYTWTVSVAGLGCTLVSATSISCTPTTPGSYEVNVTVTDSNGYTSAISTFGAYTVYGDPTASVPTPSAASGADVGQTFTFSTAASLGTGTYTAYTWTQSNGGLGCTLVNSASISCTPTVANSYTVSVKVTDSNGFTSSVATSPSYTVYSDPTVTTPTPNKPTVDVGQSVAFSTTAGSGSGSYSTYTWTETSTNLGCTLVNAASISCTPTMAGTTYTVTVKVTDSVGGTSAGATSASYTVYVDPSVSVPSPGTASVDLGQSVTFSTVASGGTGLYPTYAWTQSSGNLGCTLANAASITCTPTVAGTTYTVSVQVTDTSGFTSTVSVSGSYTVYSDPTVGVPTPSLPSVDVGQAFAFTTTASQGTGSYVTYTWTPSSANLGCVVVNAATITCIPKAAGTAYAVSVAVTDSNGKTSSIVGSALFTVYAGPTLSTPTLTVNGTSSFLADVGQTLVFTTALTSSGSGGITAYVWSGLPTGCSGVSISITCTVTGTGNFSVTATVTDSNGFTTTSGAIFVITSTDPVVPAPTANVVSADVGQSVMFQASPFGGTSPYVSYTWTGLPASGCMGTDSATPVCLLTSASVGTLNVSAAVTDTQGWTAGSMGMLSFIVYADPSLGAPTLTVNGTAASIADAGQTLVFTTTLTSSGSGGTTNFTWSGLPAGCSGTTASITCTVTGTGSFSASASVTDSNGKSAYSGPISVIVNPDLSVLAPTATANVADVGQTLAFQVIATGGTLPYSTFVWSGLPATGCTGTGTARPTCIVPSASVGTLSISVRVTDSKGWSSGSLGVILVTVHPAPSASASASPNPIDANMPVGFVGSVSGGTLNFTFAWRFGDGGTSTSKSPSHTYTKPGTYTATFWANDSLGVSATAFVVVVVSSVIDQVILNVTPSGCGFVTLDGTNYANGAVVPLTPGTYSVTATPCQNYTLQSITATGGVTLSGGNVTVSGDGSVTARFVALSSSSTQSIQGAPWWAFFLLLALLVVALVILLIVAARRRQRPARARDERSDQAASGGSMPGIQAPAPPQTNVNYAEAGIPVAVVRTNVVKPEGEKSEWDESETASQGTSNSDEQSPAETEQTETREGQ